MMIYPDIGKQELVQIKTANNRTANVQSHVQLILTDIQNEK